MICLILRFKDVKKKKGKKKDQNSLATQPGFIFDALPPQLGTFQICSHLIKYPTRLH